MGLSLRRSLTWTRKSRRVARCPESLMLKRKSKATRSRQDQPARFHQGRYHAGGGASDGLEGEEGTFTMCSFWYIENLSRAGDLDKATLLFEKLLGFASPLGLYSEQIGVAGDDQSGLALSVAPDVGLAPSGG